MTPDLTRLRAIEKNAWYWDLFAFARRLDLDPDTAYTRDLFEAFQRVAAGLARFDDRALTVLSAPTPPAETPP
jgi:hypothetical protein